MLIDLNLGSNIGDRHANLRQAVALIRACWPQAAVYESAVVESEPWGYDSPNGYLNQGLLLDVEQMPDPLDLLDSLQAIERRISPAPHRNPDGTYRDRLIDIDIIAMEGVELDTPRLQLPHPRACQRPFVTGPMAELHAAYSAHCKTPDDHV